MASQNVIERSAALMTTIDAAGRVLLFNARCEQLCGIARDTAHGRPWLELFVKPEKRAAIAAELARAQSSRLEVAFTSALPQDDGSPPRSIRWYLTELSSGVLCATGIDVTGEEEAAARCRRNERMAALGTMTAGLAHELRNPLNAAHLQLDLARRHLMRSGECRGALDAVDVASAEVSRLTRLVNEFLAFARPAALQLVRGDLREVASSTARGLRAEAAARSVDLVVEVGPPVYAEFDDVRMSQALHNLLRNAVDATGEGGRVRVALSVTDRLATILVEDSGPGLPADARVFEPFYTTKANGTGLGLAVAHQVACDHGGSIAVESGAGLTRFALSVPIL